MINYDTLLGLLNNQNLAIPPHAQHAIGIKIRMIGLLNYITYPTSLVSVSIHTLKQRLVHSHQCIIGYIVDLALFTFCLCFDYIDPVTNRYKNDPYFITY